MIDFKRAREGAFGIVERTRTVEMVSEVVKNNTSGTTTNQYWRVTVEVPVEDTIRDFILEVSLKSDFPVTLPVIKLCQAQYEETKYLPHIDTARAICLFDEESIKQNTQDPAGVVNECINQAVRILSNGLNKDRLVEFKDEIIAYWENSYSKNDKVVPGYLGGNMAELQPGIVPSYYLVQAHGGSNLYIGNQEKETEDIIGFFKMRGHTVQELNGFYLGEIENLAPPFNYNNSTLLEFIKLNFGEVWKEVKGYLNRNPSSDKFLLFSVTTDGKPVFFGFYINAFKKQLKGWRPDQSTTMIMQSIRRTEPVARVRFSEFYPERLQVRTNGRKNQSAQKQVLIAGLGSIGSHLMFSLNALEISKFVLVDPETLLIENIGRHLLSFNEVGQKKVDAAEKYIKYANPFIDVQKHAGSIIPFLENRIEEVNELDFIFCAIGKDAVETYILQLLSEGTIQKPVFIFWVEPYLLGAHALYINPGTGFSLQDLEESGFYKYNFIAKETYNDPTKKVSLKEAGCQGSYMPYSKADILRFFSAFTPILFDAIQHLPQTNTVFTYAGNLEMANELGLQLSAFSKSLTQGQILTQQI